MTYFTKKIYHQHPKDIGRPKDTGLCFCPRVVLPQILKEIQAVGILPLDVALGHGKGS